jgi:hypothetical protein
MLEHRRKLKKLNEWDDFNKKSLEWADEIKDSKVKEDFFNYCLSLLKKGKSIEEITNFFSIEEEKQKVINQFGKHIPSLLIETRDEKINNILK